MDLCEGNLLTGWEAPRRGKSSTWTIPGETCVKSRGVRKEDLAGAWSRISRWARTIKKKKSNEGEEAACFQVQKMFLKEKKS